MPKTKQWFVFYAAIGAGVVAGIVIYAILFSIAHEMVHNPGIGLPIALTFGLLIGFSYYVFFKVTLRRFTWPFLRRA